MATSTGLTIEDFEKLPDELAHNHEFRDAGGDSLLPQAKCDSR